MPSKNRQAPVAYLSTRCKHKHLQRVGTLPNAKEKRGGESSDDTFFFVLGSNLASARRFTRWSAL